MWHFLKLRWHFLALCMAFFESDQLATLVACSAVAQVASRARKDFHLSLFLDKDSDGGDGFLLLPIASLIFISARLIFLQFI